MNKKIIFLITLIIIIATNLRSYTTYSQSQYEDQRNNIETKLVIEYNLVKTLNKNNVDVTYYTNILNLAINTLRNAEKYHSIGNEQNATSNLELASALLNNVDNDVKTSLADYYSRGFFVNIQRFITPIIATILIATFTIAFWIMYKEYYYTKLLKMKPEVNKHEIK
jgi:hypothetical protein